MLDFTGVPRGRPLDGGREIAEHIWGPLAPQRRAYSLPREEFGLMELNGKITGFTGWIDAALAARAGKRRRRKAAMVTTVK